MAEIDIVDSTSQSIEIVEAVDETITFPSSASTSVSVDTGAPVEADLVAEVEQDFELGRTGAKGDPGSKGEKGNDGARGLPGTGVPIGGTTGQALVKKTNADYDGEWVDPVDISGKQDTLVSGTNIKTINGGSVLGSGDITISGGGSSLIIDTKRNILTSTPADPSVALASDTKEYYAYDGTNWNKASLKFNTDSPAPDMGYKQDNDKNGYANEYIDSKRFTNLAIGQFNEQPYEGAVRYDMSQTPPTFELYARGVWNKIFYDFQMLNGNLEHIPKTYTINVNSGSSNEKGLNGTSYIRGYSVDMGAYPRPVVIDGGQLGT